MGINSGFKGLKFKSCD